MNEVLSYLEKTDTIDYKLDQSLCDYTSFKVGGKVKAMASPRNIDAFVELITLMKEREIPFKILGKGSNILASDKPYEGVIVRCDQLNHLRVDKNIVSVGAGYALPKLAYELVKYGLTGLEFVGGIPGTVGGATYMNAGAYQSEFKDVVNRVLIIDNRHSVRWLEKSELAYDYRKSVFTTQPNWVILEVELILDYGDSIEIKELLNGRKQRRLQSQPLRYPSCGSTFKNPDGKYAWQLIEEVGLRGHRYGGAAISNKHANFIINVDQAKAEDIKVLITLVKEKVKQNTGISLIEEVEYFNWD